MATAGLFTAVRSNEVPNECLDGDACKDVLPYVMDFMKVDTQESLVSSTQSWLNTLTRESMSKESSSGFGFGFEGVSLTNSSSDKEWREYYHKLESGQISQLDYKKAISLVKSGPNPLALQVWRDCMLSRSAGSGLRLSNEERVGDRLVLTMRYNASESTREAPNEIELDKCVVTWKDQSSPMTIDLSGKKLYDRFAETLDPINGLPEDRDFVVTISVKDGATPGWTMRFRRIPDPVIYERWITRKFNFKFWDRQNRLTDETKFQLRLTGGDLAAPVDLGSWPCSEQTGSFNLDSLQPSLANADKGVTYTLELSCSGLTGVNASGGAIYAPVGSFSFNPYLLDRLEQREHRHVFGEGMEIVSSMVLTSDWRRK